MTESDGADSELFRRSVLRSAGAFAAFSLSGTTFAEVRASGALAGAPTDPHTLDVFRSIVDAIVPRTPALAESLGSEHEPGALDVGVEEFLVWDFDHFHEVRVRTLDRASAERFEAAFRPGDLDGLVDGLALSGETAELTDFGSLERFDVTVASVPEEGPVDLDVVVETESETVHRVMQNYPYAEALATAFELIAAEFVARGGNEKQPMAANEAFPAGGLFVRLSPRDRLRCLDSAINGGGVDRLDDALGAFLPAVGVLKFAVMGVFGLTTLSYYSEWPAYGGTRTAAPNERELSAPPGGTVGREQTGYPGPEPGYAAHRGFELQSFRENEWGNGS